MLQIKEEIRGEYIVLKKVTPEDAPYIFNWRSGISGKFMRQPVGYSLSSQQKWIESRKDNEMNYIIHDIQTGEKVGMIGIYEVNEEDKVANVGRLLLADKYLKTSTPYGLEALLLGYGCVLNEMGFRKITGDILAKNIEMFKMQIFLGMKQEGYLKDHIILNGVPEDLYIMSITKEEFSIYKKKINFLLKRFKTS